MFTIIVIYPIYMKNITKTCRELQLIFSGNEIMKTILYFYYNLFS